MWSLVIIYNKCAFTFYLSIQNSPCLGISSCKLLYWSLAHEQQHYALALLLLLTVTVTVRAVLTGRVVYTAEAL